VNFDSGAVGTLMNSVVSPRMESYVRLDFEFATAEVRALYRYSNENWSFSAAEAAPAEVTAAWPPPDDVASFHEAQYRLILDALQRGEPPPVSTESVRVVTEFISALYKSAATRQLVQRGSITANDPFYERMAGTLTSGPLRVRA